jgi:hypothetical protein
MLKHRVIALLAGTGLAAGVMSSASIASASATSHCRVEVTQLHAWELQDGDGEDEIRFELGDDTYGTFTFTQGQSHSTSLGSPTEETTGSTVPFKLWERDWPTKTTIGKVTLSCEDGPHDLDLEGHGAGYTLWYTTSH